MTLSQDGANLLYWGSVLEKLTGGDRLTSAGGTSRGMIGAKTIQQIFMAFVLLAATVAIQLGQQIRVLPCRQVRLAGLTLEEFRV